MTADMQDPTQTSGARQAPWLNGIAWPTTTPLAQDTETDVCIVGGGVAGLTTAYLLVQAGRSVVVLEDGALGSGESGRTTAHLSAALDDRYYYLEKLHGTEGAALAAEAHREAIDAIERICQTEGIEAQFCHLHGYLFLAPGCPPDELVQEKDAAERAGFTGLRMVPAAEGQGVAWRAPALMWPGQAQIHAGRYLAGLAEAVLRRGGRIYTHTHAEALDGRAGTVSVAGGHTVSARHIVVATNTPFNNRVAMHTKQSPYRTYAIALRAEKGSITQALYWDTADPYHYVRLQPEADYDLLIAGGQDHKVGQPDPADPDPFATLEAWTREHFPPAGERLFAWSGQVLEPADSLGYAGRNTMDADNVYLITGDSGHGYTHATLGAQIVADLIAGRDNPFAQLFDPSRVTVQKDVAQTFAAENLNVAAAYTELLTGGDAPDTAAIAPGSGAVLRRGLTKVAVYKSAEGQLTECSAICPHLGCVVHWNSHEQSWDCPCHGSRFTPDGALLMGPANSGLSPA